MFKKLSIVFIISGVILLGYCAISAIWINTATSNEEEEGIDKKDDGLLENCKTRRTSYIY